VCVILVDLVQVLLAVAPTAMGSAIRVLSVHCERNTGLQTNGMMMMLGRTRAMWLVLLLVFGWACAGGMRLFLRPIRPVWSLRLLRGSFLRRRRLRPVLRTGKKGSQGRVDDIYGSEDDEDTCDCRHWAFGMIKSGRKEMMNVGKIQQRCSRYTTVQEN
jgi:hypothetical protein